MAAPAFIEAILERLSPFLGKLPIGTKRKTTAIDEPFQELEDSSPESDESFAPNALSAKTRGKVATRLDFGAIAKDLLSKPGFVATLAALALFCVALVVVSIVVNAAPPQQTARSKLAPSTPEGRAEAARLLLPSDPALDLSPPMERTPRFPYTDEDIRRLTPAHPEDEVAPIAERNDRAMDALFGAVP